MQAIVLTPNQLQNLMFQASPLENLSIEDAQDNLMNLGAHITKEKADLMKAALKAMEERKNGGLMNLQYTLSAADKAGMMKGVEAMLAMIKSKIASGPPLSAEHQAMIQPMIAKAEKEIAAYKAQAGLMNLQQTMSAADKAKMLEMTENLLAWAKTTLKTHLAAGPVSAEHLAMMNASIAKLEKSIADAKAQAGLVNLQQTMTPAYKASLMAAPIDLLKLIEVKINASIANGTNSAAHLALAYETLPII
jgi:hypothetical protein